MSTKQRQTETQQNDFLDQIIEAVKPIIDKMNKENDAIVISVLTDGDKAMSKCMVVIAGTTNNVCSAINALNKDENFKIINAHNIENNLRAIISFLGDSDCKN